MVASHGLDEDRVDDLFSMWKVASDVRESRARRAAFEQHPALPALAGYDRRVLNNALYDARRRYRISGEIDLNRWLAMAALNASAASDGIRVDLSSDAVARAWQLVLDRDERARTQQLRLPFPGDVVAEALVRLKQRVGEANATWHHLKRRTPRWRAAPAGNLVGAPIVEADDPELAVVGLLAATADHWQFSSTPDGHMFIGTMLGYHHEEERTYVSGLSDVLDTAAGVVESHRAGAGGRVYVTQRHVQCAECKLVICWVNQQGAGTAAFGKCTAAQRR